MNFLLSAIMLIYAECFSVLLLLATMNRHNIETVQTWQILVWLVAWPVYYPRNKLPKALT